MAVNRLGILQELVVFLEVVMEVVNTLELEIPCHQGEALVIVVWEEGWHPLGLTAWLVVQRPVGQPELETRLYHRHQVLEPVEI